MADPEPPDPLALIVLGELASKRWTDALVGHGLALAELQVLRLLLAWPNDSYRTAQDLSGSLGLARNTIDRIVRALKAQDYVSIEPMSHGRKRNQLTITDKGKLKLAEVDRTIDAFRSDLGRHMGENSLNEFLIVASALVARLRADDTIL